MKVDFTRECALKILHKVEEENGYSNLVLDEYLQSNRERLNNRDAGFISEIVYGCTTRRLTLNTILEKYSKVKLNKISKWVLIILHIGIYQIVFLDKVPKSAAVNESVNLCKKYCYKSASFVNAVLRKVEKSDYKELWNIKDELARISKVHSMPEWIVKKLINEYGVQKAEEICKYSNIKPKMTVRVNTLKISKEQLKIKLQERDIEYEEGEIPNFLYIKNLKNISSLDLFNEGLFTVQDEGAGKISIVLNPNNGEKVLDACSAPGGKTTHLAEIMKNEGLVIAWDIHSHRVKLVEENAKRLGISIIKTEEKDARQYDEKYEGKFDKILLDVPCMGLGVLKRKPDIKWKKEENDVYNICKIQQEILKVCSKYLKLDGELVYSTCSILKEENEEMIESFIQNMKKRENLYFKVMEQYNILPNENEDGFFICKIKRMNP